MKSQPRFRCAVTRYAGGEDPAAQDLAPLEAESPETGLRESGARCLGPLLLWILALLGTSSLLGATEPFDWSVSDRAGSGDGLVDLNLEPPIQFVLDDGVPEADFGVGGTTARQFLWLNQFESPGGLFQLESVCVAFPINSNLPAGSPIELVVYFDTDDDPTNGATLLGTYPREIGVLAPETCAMFELDRPLLMHDGTAILIGVINRFVTSGVSSPIAVAVLDTTLSQGRSWIAIWQDDPPPEPDLQPDLYFDRIDTLIPGNWVIRGFGRRPITVIPTLGMKFLIGFGALLSFAAIGQMRRLG